MIIPDGSIYIWMYTQGLKHIPLDEIIESCGMCGKPVRDKDIRNYWNGWHRSWFHEPSMNGLTIMDAYENPGKKFSELSYHDYPVSPVFGIPDVSKKWVPCNANNKPLIHWSNGCLSYEDAIAWPGRKYLAENNVGQKQIIIDIDGDHGDQIDMETIMYFDGLRKKTHTMVKPDAWMDGHPTSYHLTFFTDRIIPTMHFPKAKVDIVGNKRNSLRYFKKKLWNGLDPIPMTDRIWDTMKAYIERRQGSNGNDVGFHL